MKKVLIGIILSILVLAALPYFFIPSTIRKSIYTITTTTQHAAQRFLLDESKWVAWWPGNNATYNGNSFRVSKQLLTGVELIASNGNDSTTSLLSIIPSGRDTIKLAWEFERKASLNPFTRITQNNRANSLKKDIGFIIQQLAVFLANEENIYGIKIDHAIVTDTLLVSTKMIIHHEPDVVSIYRLIDQLQQYITASGAQATNSPMLNKRRIDSAQYEVMVALPVNKVLVNKGSIAFKRMVPGNILVTEVQGGPGAVQAAFHTLENYIAEHHYESPAIPFESLITNRLQQPDTTKWVTRLYYPVF